jgi:hypothetical protein
MHAGDTSALPDAHDGDATGWLPCADDHGDDPDGRPARPRRWPGVLAWGLAGLTVLSLVPGFWLAELVFSTGWEPRPAIATLGAVVLATMSAATVGALVASRRPATRWGRCCSAWAWRCRGACWSSRYVDYGE